MPRFILVSLFVANLALLIISAAPVPARAQAKNIAGGQGGQESANIFAIGGILVDVAADSAVAAKKKALGKAAAIAAMQLFRRLIPVAHHDRVPAITIAQAQPLVDTFGVKNEKTSASRYIGELNFIFNRAGILKFLDDHDLPYSVTVSGPLLVLPVLRRESGAVLFSENNPWRRAWENYRHDPNDILPILLPFGDVEDVTTLDGDKALERDPAALERLARRYGVGKIMIARADLVEGRESRLDFLAAMAKDGEGANGGSNGSVRRKPGEGLDAMMDRAVRTIVRDFREQWKLATLVAVGEVQSDILVRAELGSYARWQALAKRLRRVSALHQFDTQRLSKQSVTLRLVYAGNIDRLQLALAQHGLILTKTEEDEQPWQLTFRGQRSSLRPAGKRKTTGAKIPGQAK